MINKTIKNCLLLATSIVSVNATLPTVSFAQSQNQAKFAKGQLIIKLSAASEANLISIANFAKSQNALKITSMLHSTAIIELNKDIPSQAKNFANKVNLFANTLNTNASPNRMKRVKANSTSQSQNSILITFPESIKVEQLMGLFAGRSGVSEISLNHELQLHAFPNDRFVDSDQNGQLDYNAATGLPHSWHLQTTGADKPKAQTGRGIVVAVIDSGTIEETNSNSGKILTNPELGSQHWINPKEIAGDGIDNDGNGFVDDIHGSNIIADEECDSKGTSCGAISRGVPWSHTNDYHGVMVASTIAAKSNNQIGIAGIADGVKIMGVKVFHYAKPTTNSTVAKGILYAVRNGADVINLSLGGEFGPAATSQRKIIEDALDTAYSNGVIVVASAGNERKDSVNHLPSASPKVISVAATDYNNVVSTFSNFGTSVDIAAPGTKVTVMTPSNYLGVIGAGAYGPAYINQPQLFGPMNGTSFSAPIISGVVALMLEKNPNLKMEQIASILKATATPIVGDTKGIQGGIVNIPRALAQVPEIAPSSGYLQNRNNPFDTNADGQVAPLDVLIVINALNARQQSPGTFVDVNGDGQLSPLDALQVINFLNARR